MTWRATSARLYWVGSLDGNVIKRSACFRTDM
jgi:hypothetical protein